MSDRGLFVVTVASEKGGVGKTTIATNLAVYLKALREDLPVTVASFDNHFTVDHMFSIAGRRGASVAGFFDTSSADSLPEMGEYGVQFVASAPSLSPPDDDGLHLHRKLSGSSLAGILIFDTRPVLDYFTRNALLCADLILVPVKDRASLVNAASIHKIAEEGSDPQRTWVLPSLIDRRLRLRGETGMAEFLSFSARERGYRVLDICLDKSPRVESLATGFSSRVFPVITHAPTTAVHRQFRLLAEFVLSQRDQHPPRKSFRSIPSSAAAGGRRRKMGHCPLCGQSPRAGEGVFFQSLGQRSEGILHEHCCRTLMEFLGTPPSDGAGVLLLRVEGAGFSGPEAQVAWTTFTEGGELECEGGYDVPVGPVQALLEGATGRHLSELGKDCLLLFPGFPGAPDDLPGLRRRVLRGSRGG